MNVDIRHLEESTNTLIYTEKAFGASFKADALKPNENFLSVSMNAPSKKNYSYAVLQGSATDITNLDTSSFSAANHEVLKQEVLIASQNMISAARNIVLRNPSIKKVLILDRIPRFDPLSADPAQLKSSLSQFGNNILREELDKCDVKDRISIGKHSLPTQCQQNLYGHPERFGYDAVHLRGPDGKNHYTRSVCNILQSFLSIHSREPHNHSIPILSSGHHIAGNSTPMTASSFYPPSSQVPSHTMPRSQNSNSKTPNQNTNAKTPSSSSHQKFYSSSFPNPSYRPSRNQTPDYVIIEMEADVIPQHFYKVPTSNF